ALGTSETGRCNLQAGSAEPGIGELETLVSLAENLLLGQAAIVELKDSVGVTAMRDVPVSVADGEPRRALVDEEGGDLLPSAAPRGIGPIFLARGHEYDGETGNIRVADEMLCAVEHP